MSSIAEQFDEILANLDFGDIPVAEVAQFPDLAAEIAEMLADFEGYEDMDYPDMPVPAPEPEPMEVEEVDVDEPEAFVKGPKGTRYNPWIVDDGSEDNPMQVGSIHPMTLRSE
jgi:hypothetical protein